MVFQIGLLGLGTVGTATAQILLEPQGRHPLLAEIEIARVGVRSPDKPRTVTIPSARVTTDLKAIATDPQIDIVVELLGGLEPARGLILEAINNGKHVVTANKAVMSRYGEEIFRAAREAGVYVLLEGAVCGGIPAIRPLKQALCVNRIQQVLGIVNGTTNYILTQMSAVGADFDDVLAEAQRLGYAEADPSADVDGYDAADKIAILASLAFGQQVPLKSVHREGITGITRGDIRYAEQLGFTIKLLAIAQREANDSLQVRVHPTLVPQSHPLANINGVTNAIAIQGEPLGQVTFIGPGAGGGATASAVVSDIANIVALLKSCQRVQAPHPLLSPSYSRQGSVAPIQELVSRFYARIICVDRPGVIGSIGTTFGQHEVSLESIVQLDLKGDLAEIVVITHDVREGNFRSAIEELVDSNAIASISIPSILRVLASS